MQPSRRLLLYMLGLAAAGLVSVALALRYDPPLGVANGTVLATLLLTLSTLTYLMPVKVGPKRSLVLGASLQTVAFLTLPPAHAALVIGGSAALGNMYLRRPWFNVLFNAGQVGLAVLAAGELYRLLSPASVASPASPGNVGAFLPASATLYLVSALAVDGAVAIQAQRSPFHRWLPSHAPGLAAFLILTAVGGVSTAAIARQPLLIVLVVAPIVMVRQLMRGAAGFDAEVLRLAEAVAAKVDAPQVDAVGRSQRLATLAAGLAAACGLTAEDAQRVALAARLHDVAAGYARLRANAGAETTAAAQRQFRQQHAADGARWIQSTLQLHGIAEALRFHHERYDGRGQPTGLVGVNIPLDARLLAVCEAWIDLTTPSPYHQVLSAQQALLVLHAGARTQWDPDIVHALHNHILGVEAESARAGRPARSVPNAA